MSSDTAGSPRSAANTDSLGSNGSPDTAGSSRSAANIESLGSNGSPDTAGSSRSAGNIESLDKLDRALLEFIQRDIPLEEEPFVHAARRLELSQEEAAGRLTRLLDEGYIRTISALVHGSALGYRSTLAAVKVPAGRVEQTAARIGSHPGVSHNYLREDEYNLWFTIAVPPGTRLGPEVEKLLEGSGCEDLMLLPSLRRYKLRVQLPVGTAPEDAEPKGEARSADATPAEPPAHPGPGPGRASGGRVSLDAADRRLLRALQRPMIPAVRLWDEPARIAGLTTEEFITRTERLKREGVIRRISGALQHRKSGYRANAMTVFSIPEGREEEAGRRAASFPEVSHCYLREVPAHWPYPLFAMIHAADRESCRRSAARVAEAAGAAGYRLLFSTKEYKKQRIVYEPEAL